MQPLRISSHLTLVSLASCIPWPLAASSSHSELVERASAPLPTPLSLTPSQYWDGDDGKWSTFEFQVGTPSQQIRLLPGTSTSTLYFIAPQGCTAAANDSNTCPQDRGGTFNPVGSSTWSPLGTFQYQGTYSQSSLLGDLAEAEYGDDTVVLAWPGSPAPTLDNQIIAGIQEKNIWYVGNFGISPRALNITTLSNSHPAPLQNLRQRNLIPSTTWGYTAGFQKAQYPTFGSLTFGGYDTTRFRSNGITFPFGNDISRDLLVSVQAISSSAATSAGGLLPTAINAFIDSTIPTIWLPIDACQAFEKAFNLTWDDADQYYLLTDQQHQNLQQLNPTVTFTLGSSLAGGNTVDIVLPYAAFDLQLTAPIATSPTFYFPLQRAANSTQYVLGRTFLQHAYVIADYDRNNFSVSQALFPQQNVQPNIVPIYPPGVNANGQNETAQPSSSLSGGSIAGIVVAIVVVLAIIAATVFFWRYKRHQKAKKEAAAAALAQEQHDRDYPTAPGMPPRLHSGSMSQGGPPEYGAYEKAELDVTRDGSGTPLTERSPGTPLSGGAGFPSIAGKTELSGEGRDVHEAPDTVKEKRGELDSTPALKRHEMDAGQTVSEMEGTEGEAKPKKDSRGGGGGSGPVYELP